MDCITNNFKTGSYSISRIEFEYPYAHIYPLKEAWMKLYNTFLFYIVTTSLVSQNSPRSLL